MTNSQKMPNGYKQTEVGVIPEDWNVSKLDEVSKVIDPHPSHRAPEEKAGGIPFVGIGDLNKNGEFVGDNYRRVSSRVFDEHRNRYQLEKNLLGLGRVASIGKVVKLKNTSFKYTVSPTLGIIEPQSIDAQFLYYALNSKFVNAQFKKIMSGSTRSSVGMIVLRNIYIQIPVDVNEQTVIANVLSDTDVLIEKLEKLIEKKKAIKHGAMQQLLTGKKRLPGFSGEWMEKKLGDLLQYEQPTKYIVKNTDYSDKYNIPVLTAGKSFLLGFTNEEVGIFDNLPVIIFDDFTTASKYVDFKFKVKSSAMKILKTRSDDSNLRFLYDKMQLIDFKLGDHKRYWISEYQHLLIKVPHKVEQDAIADVLSDMDAEIGALEEKLEKYQQIKAGMMQKLLTGKIRIIN